MPTPFARNKSSRLRQMRHMSRSASRRQVTTQSLAQSISAKTSIPVNELVALAYKMYQPIETMTLSDRMKHNQILSHNAQTEFQKLVQSIDM